MRFSLAVGLLSGAAIACEILQMRLLSIVQWHHFAFLVISLALLGYGASGAFLTVLRKPLLRRFGAVFPLLAIGFALTSVGSFAVAQRLRLNPLEVIWDPRQFVAFAALYLVLAIPFFCAGSAIGLTLMRFEGSLHTIYRADLVGAAFGAASAIAALYLLAPEVCLRGVGLAGWVAAAAATLARAEARRRPGEPGSEEREERSRDVDTGASEPNRGRRALVAASLLAVGVAVSLSWPVGWITPRMSEFKAEAKALTVPGVEILAERSSPLGVISVLRSPRVPFRIAPGLSLTYAGSVPEQLIVFSDGEIAAIVAPAADEPEALDYLASLPPALAFELRTKPRAALVGTGGGTAVNLALRMGASRVHLIETDPEVLSVVAEDLAELTGELYRDPRLTLHGKAPRGFLAADRGKFDLIWLELPAGGSPAAYALEERYTETVEAFSMMVERLDRGGLLAIGGEMDAPPRAILRVLATAGEALERLRLEPGELIVAIRSWNSFLVLVRPDGWTASDLGTVRDFVAARSFDLVYYPGMQESEANRFNLLPTPELFRGAVALLGPDRLRFIEQYAFDVSPTVDDRPYFFHFVRWQHLGELVAQRARGGAALIEWGHLLLLAAVVQAALAGLVLILLPLWAVGRRARSRRTGRVGIYFLCLGLAFLMLEIAFIQRLTLFLADPLRAAATVLAGFLFFAGLGSGASRRLERRWGRRALPSILIAIAGLAVLYLLVLPPLFRAGMGLSLWVKLPAVLVLIAPLAFLMGMPFPLGLDRIARLNRPLLPWAWGVNGWASVLSAVLAALLAVDIGFSAVIGIGCALYLVAGCVVPPHVARAE